MIGKCAKQEVIAIVENHGRYWIGSNYCNRAREDCPRKGMPTGAGYERCLEVCQQFYHAEVRAMIAAGQDCKDGKLYVIGHTYACETCRRTAEEMGITEIIVGRLPEAFYKGGDAQCRVN